MAASPDEATKAYSLGCEGGNSDACQQAGRLLLKDVVTKLPKPAPLERPAAVADGSEQKASSSSVATSVLAAAPLDRDSQRTLQRAAGYLAKGCFGGVSASHGNNCFLLATMHMDSRLGLGLNLTTEEAKAAVAKSSGEAPLPWETMPDDIVNTTPAQLLARACDSENVKACNTLSKLYRAGNARFGVAQDAAKADSYAMRGLMLGGMSERQAERQMKLLAEKAAAAAGGGAK